MFFAKLKKKNSISWRLFHIIPLNDSLVFHNYFDQA